MATFSFVISFVYFSFPFVWRIMGIRRKVRFTRIDHFDLGQDTVMLKSRCYGHLGRT